MKKLFRLWPFLVFAAVSPQLYGQTIAPPGAGDRDLRDTSIRSRSVELERIDRAAQESGSGAAINPKITEKFAEIKADFEQIQLAEAVIIKIYQTGKTIDYAKIAKSARKIYESAVRLDANMFAVKDEPAVKNSKAKKDAGPMPAGDIRSVIVALDNAIGDFVSSPMFQNTKTADTAVLAKAKSDVERVKKLSLKLETEANQTAASQK